MFNKYSRKRKMREFKDALYIRIFIFQCYIAANVFGYDWKTGKYDKKHIIGRFLYKESRIGTTLIPKKEVEIQPMSLPTGTLFHLRSNYETKE